MRIYFGGIFTETNSFAPSPVGQRAFEEGGVYEGGISSGGEKPENLIAQKLLELSVADHHELVEGVFATAQPSGLTVHGVYEFYRNKILADLKSKGPFDVVLLYLHGAMISTECDDCEGDILLRVRSTVGRDVTIGVELDPHCHLTERMVSNANVVILMKEYPHTDFVARASELYDLCMRARRGEIRPVAGIFDMHMIGVYPTGIEPLAGLLKTIREAENQPGILSASFVHGFPWADTAEMGSKMLIYADNDADLAIRTARELGESIYRVRESLKISFVDIERALDQIRATSERVVMADTADNAGGGAPSDNVTLLRAILRRRMDRVAVGAIWDPIAVQICADAGVGARFPLRLGGKSGPTSGEPLDLIVRVAAIRDNHHQSILGGSQGPMGLSVWLQVGEVDVLVNSHRTQLYAPDAFTGIGIELGQKRLIVVKSTNHFRANFTGFASHIIPVATPGALQMNFAAIDYRKRRNLNFYPRIADPLALDNRDLP